jgi:hypothetical protein
MGQSSPEAKKAWLARNQHKRAEICNQSRLRNFYGITTERFDEMCFEQGGRCAICLREIAFDKVGYEKLHIDHNHETRYVRGLLCGRCNLGIGQFEDRIDLLQNAVLYLQSRKTPEDFVFTVIPKPPRKPNSQKQRDSVRAHATGNKYREGKDAWNKGKAWDELTRTKMSESAIRRWEKEKV